MTNPLPVRRALGVTAVAAALLGAYAVAPRPTAPGPDLTGRPRPRQQAGQAGEESVEMRIAREQFDQARTAPSGVVNPGAYSAAFSYIGSMATTGGAWTEVTNKPYNADDLRYRDPYFSNSGGGAGLVSGRIVAIAVDGPVVYIGGADGGVFRSADNGVTWTALSDDLPTLSVGDLKVNPADHSLWLATGEGNTGGTSYVGSGVYRLPAGAPKFTQAMRVGGTELESRFVNSLAFGGGRVFAATSRGLWRRSLSAPLTSPWELSYAPNPASLNDTTGSNNAAYDNIANDVIVDPKAPNTVLANVAWRAGAPYNGFYVSTAGGAPGSWKKVNPTGAINPKEVGNASLAYSADGRKLYTVVESTFLYNQAPGIKGYGTVLAGVYMSATGNVTGPWTLIADSEKLYNSGSALKPAVGGFGYQPGVQAWYNQFIGVDPNNANHVYVGLEEVYETTNAGKNWKTIGPYWNFYFDCWTPDPTTCPGTTHSDQHAVAFGNGKVYVGNDGGIYARRLVNAPGWENLNRNVRTLQYYSVGTGYADLDGDGDVDAADRAQGVAVAGGLQDNGGSLLLPNDTEMGSPFGGDGGDIIVDPDNACRIVDEYANLSVWVTDSCGRSDGTTSSIRDVNPLDPSPRFIAPLEADPADAERWIAAGRFVYENTLGWDIRSGSDWDIIGDTGSGHSTTAVDTIAGVTYAGWCGPCNNAGFTRGAIKLTKTASGGYTQTTVNTSALPNRFIQGLLIDPSDATGDTVYATIGGFSRKFTEGPGVGFGHVFKSTDGGQSWTDISGAPGAAGSFPDVPANDAEVIGSSLVVGTDLGVYARPLAGGAWRRVGTGLPMSTVMDLHVGPDNALYAATHGRGIWKVPAAGL